MKVNLTVEAGIGSLKDFDLRKDEALATLVNQAVAELGLSNPEQYAFYSPEKCEYLDQARLSRGDLSGVNLILKRKPELEADDIVKMLTGTDLVEKKRCLPKLKSKLTDNEFLRVFISKGGINLVTSMVKDIGEDGSKSVLSFVLNILERLFSMRVGWERADADLASTIIPFIGQTTNSNICAKAMQIATYLSQSPAHGFSSVDSALRALADKQGEKAYELLMAHLNNTDLNVQTSCLRLINSIFGNITDDLKKKEYLDMMTDLGINKVLQRRRHLTDTNLKEEVYQFQRVRLWALSCERVPYEKSNPEHEARLQILWDLVFPDEALEARVCNQWKNMGFQGQDPATDFRGTGMLGLNNLIYVAENYTSKFSKIVNTQRDRKDHDYPVAVAGINLTQMLYELMFVEKEDPEHTVFPLLFDHAHAFEEVYFIAFELLDHTWDAMNAEYMDFPKVIEAVRMKLQMIFSSSPNLDQIKAATRVTGAVPLTAAGGTAGSGSSHSDAGPVGQLRAEVEREMTNLVRNQKMEFLRHGCGFEVAVAGGKSKASEKKPAGSGLNFMYLRLVRDELRYGPVPDLDCVPEESPAGVKASDCTDILVGLSCPSYAGTKGKKGADEAAVGLTFSLMLTSGEDISLVARDAANYSNWTDGLRVWLGKIFSNADSLDDLKALVDAEVEVRLLDLAGVTVPTSAPLVPDLPQNYDFVFPDEAELANRPTGKPKVSESSPRRSANFTMGAARRAGFQMGSRQGPGS